MSGLIGWLLGVGFGFVLERAGFGSGCKLTAQFRLTDWSVFKVMFTAIVFAAVGMYAFERAGWLDAQSLYVPDPFLWAAGLGGAVIGAGFAIGGYCPGTSIVGLTTGRLDAVAFFMGLIAGTFAFAELFGVLEPLTQAGELHAGARIPEATGIPEWAILVAMSLAAVAVFRIGESFERRARRAGSI